jgi:GT2 family glycosyltransferase
MDILIYDNSSSAQAMPTSHHWNIHYIHNPENPGVGAAYNSGFELAKKLGKNWLLLLDQDTRYSINTLNEYTNSIWQYPDQEIFIPQLHDQGGLVSPFQFQLGGGKRILLNPGVHSIHNYIFHNCGLFISMNAFDKAGGYDERFPLDFSDLTFVKRLQKKIDSFVLTTSSAKHSLATSSRASFKERAMRFRSYVKACRLFITDYSSGSIFISLRLFLRTLKLCWEYKTFRFIIIYLNP